MKIEGPDGAGEALLTLREEVDHLSERQEVVADLLVSKKDLQKEAPKSIKRRSSRHSRRSYKRSTS